MTQNSNEISIQSAQPVDFYEFTFSNQYFRYTSSTETLIYSGHTFDPAVITRSDFLGNPAQSAFENSLSLSVPSNFPILQLFKIHPPATPIVLNIYSGNMGDSEVILAWKGRVKNGVWTDSVKGTLLCEDILSSMERNMLRKRHQVQCPFVLYDQDCKVSSVLFREVATVTAINGLKITTNLSPGKIANWYGGGKMIWTSSVSGGVERRMIRESNPAGEMTISGYPIGLSVGQEVIHYAGCDHTFSGANGCKPKFNNGKRHGGKLFMPTKKPFSGSSIF